MLRKAMETGDQVGAPGGGPLGEDHPQGHSQAHSAEDGSQHGVHRREGVDGGDQVHQHRGGRHGEEGGHQSVPTQEFPSQDENGNIQHQHHRADGDGRGEVVQNHAQGGETAEADLVGHVEPVEAEGVEHGAEENPGVIPHHAGEGMLGHRGPPCDRVNYLPCQREGDRRRRRWWRDSEESERFRWTESPRPFGAPPFYKGGFLEGAII